MQLKYEVYIYVQKSMIKRMFSLKTTVGLLMLGFMLAATPTLAFANAKNVDSSEERVMLLGQIKELLAEVVHLQALLEKQSLSTSYSPYKTVFFNRPFEAIYLVEDGQLLPVGSNQSVRLVDRQLFGLFSSVLGQDIVSSKVKEWRVFNDSISDLGAFVELKTGTDDWVVGVNRFSFSNSDSQIKKYFANLFIHEYFHIILFSDPVFNEAFQNKFWTTLDYKHKATSESSSETNRFDILRSYFESNKDRFVSDYATLSPDEDMAETFVSFVLEPKPIGFTISERKILYFYNNSGLVSVREKLRDNLSALDLL